MNDKLANQITTPQEAPPAPKNGSSAHKGIPLIRLIELRKKGLSYPEIGQLVGCSHQSVQERLAPFMEAIENLPAIKDHRADLFTVYGHSILSSLQEGDIKEASLLQRVTAMGILYDKERLERGQSTANVAYADLGRSVAASEARKADLMAKLGLSPSDLRDVVFDSEISAEIEQPDYVKSPLSEDNQ